MAAPASLPSPNYILQRRGVPGALRGLSSGLYLRHGITLMEHCWASSSAPAGLLLGVDRHLPFGRPADVSVHRDVPVDACAGADLRALWLGLGAVEDLSAAIICFLPGMVNTIAGLRSADEDRVSLMRSLGAPALQVFIYSACRARCLHQRRASNWPVLSLIGVIVAEFVGAEAGLGTLDPQTMNFNMDIAGSSRG